MSAPTITELAARLTDLAAIAADGDTDVEVHDAVVEEQLLIEKMILLRQATNPKEAAAQLALVFGEMNDGDWSHTPGDDVNRHMKKLARIVASVFGVVANDLTPREATLGGYVAHPQAAFSPAPAL